LKLVIYADELLLPLPYSYVSMYLYRCVSHLDCGQSIGIGIGMRHEHRHRHEACRHGHEGIGIGMGMDSHGWRWRWRSALP
jgi:hypothetical protein